jgi:uncharacterized protein
LKIAAFCMAGASAACTGVAAPYNEKDLGGDILRPGLFAKSLAESGDKLPLLWSHDVRAVLGVVTASTNDRALTVDGELLTEHVEKSREVYQLLKVGAIRGLSVGFLPQRKAPLSGGGTEYLEARLCEVSLCSIPSYAQAQVVEVRHLAGLDRDGLLALKSAIDARLVPETPAPDPVKELLEALQTFDTGRWSSDGRMKLRSSGGLTRR